MTDEQKIDMLMGALNFVRNTASDEHDKREGRRVQLGRRLERVHIEAQVVLERVGFFD